MSLVWASIHCESKLEKQIYKLGKVNDRIPVLHLTRSKPGLRLEWKIVEAFKGGF